MERLYPRSMETLPIILEAVAAFCAGHGAAGDSTFVISFAVEEIFTNMVKYNPLGPDNVSLTLMSKGNDLVVTLEDEQDHMFDPTTSPDPEFEKSLSERRPGGLGLFLIKKMVRKVEYRREGRRNTITLTHPLE
jgi:anti-sigma regulatory factor (Ser/Thr protein kinase)